jgi:mono/diheme cytochrome c family protein
MGRLATVVVTLIVAFVVLAGGAIVLAMSGHAPVAAANRHSGLIEWYLNMASDEAVDHGGESVHPPAGLDAPEVQKMGMQHYVEMCQTCHGGRGVAASEIGQGLYPRPPKLERHLRARIEPTYWIVKNGIRDTGMPAFGPTHSEQELWAIAAFTVAMPHMTPEEYAQKAKEVAAMPEEGEHEMAGPGAAAPPSAAVTPPALNEPHGHASTSPASPSPDGH